MFLVLSQKVAKETTMAPSFKSRNDARMASFTVADQKKINTRCAIAPKMLKRTRLGKDLIIDQYYIRLPHQIRYPFTLQHIPFLEFDLAHAEAPHPTPLFHLLQLRPRQLRRHLSDLNPVTSASGQHTGL
jgi:hypothetical protein